MENECALRWKKKDTLHMLRVLWISQNCYLYNEWYDCCGIHGRAPLFYNFMNCYYQNESFEAWYWLITRLRVNYMREVRESCIIIKRLDLVVNISSLYCRRFIVIHHRKAAAKVACAYRRCCCCLPALIWSYKTRTFYMCVIGVIL